MKHAQVINFNEDAVMVFIGNNVIDATTQDLIHDSSTTLLVDMKLWDLMSNAPVTISALTMNYDAASGYWRTDISGISGSLHDRHKYVGTVSPNSGESEDFIPFQITEFAVDNESLDDVLMRMSYEIMVSGGEAWFYWYSVGHHGDVSYRKFAAQAYEGGTGTTYATDASRVTHRGPIASY